MLQRQSSARTVLVVEDDPNIGELLGLVLESDGYAVTTAATGQAALDLVHRVHPGLVTLDLHLPDIAGVDILRRIKAEPELRDIPVVVISAFTEELTPSDGKLVAAIVPKPFEIDDVIGAVGQLMSA